MKVARSSCIGINHKQRDGFSSEVLRIKYGGSQRSVLRNVCSSCILPAVSARHKINIIDIFQVYDDLPAPNADDSIIDSDCPVESYF